MWSRAAARTRTVQLRVHAEGSIRTVSPPVCWRLSFQVRMTVMAAPRKYPAKPGQRAIGVGGAARCDPVSRPGAGYRIGDQLRANPEKLGGWGVQAEALNPLFMAELIDKKGPRCSISDLKITIAAITRRPPTRND